MNNFSYYLMIKVSLHPCKEEKRVHTTNLIPVLDGNVAVHETIYL